MVFRRVDGSAAFLRIEEIRCITKQIVEVRPKLPSNVIPFPKK